MPYNHNTSIIEIQLIRAISITSVVLFHLYPNQFPYGWMGVDVFFVVSGYLIINKIFIQLTGPKSFSIRRFLFERFMRLYPALAFVATISSLLAAIFVTFDDGRQRIAFSTGISSLFFISNLIIPSLSGGYFQPAANMNLFLHTWSLSAEFQIYIFAALVFLIAAKFSTIDKSAPIVLTAIGFISISLFLLQNSSLQFNFFGSRTLFDYYSPIYRVWEFNFGGIIYFLTKRFSRIRNSRWLSILKTFLFPVLTLLLTTHFNLPMSIESYYLLFVVATTGMLLLTRFANKENSFVMYLLKRISFIGDISYVLYLWHWPLIVLFRKEDSSVSNPLLVYTLSLALAVFTHKFIENRYTIRYVTKHQANIDFRKISANSLSFPISRVALLISPIFLLGLLTYLQSQRYFLTTLSVQQFAKSSPATNCPSSPPNFGNRITNGIECRWGTQNLGKSRVAVVGDSQALSLWPGMTEESKLNQFEIFLFAKPGCPYLLSVAIDPTDLACAAWVKDVQNRIINGKFDFVLIANRSLGYVSPGWGWNSFIDPLDSKRVRTSSRAISLYSAALADTLKSIPAPTKTLVLSNIPDSNSSYFPTVWANFILSKPEPKDKIKYPLQNLHRVALLENERAVAAQFANVAVIDSWQILCGVTCPFKRHDVSLYSDGSHLSSSGASLVAEVISQYIKA